METRGWFSYATQPDIYRLVVSTGSTFPSSSYSFIKKKKSVESMTWNLPGVPSIRFAADLFRFDKKYKKKIFIHSLSVDL